MASSWIWAVLLLSHTVQSTTTFGVGFSLSDDYGVASVAFRDESNQIRTQNIAKIAGSRLYTRTMTSAFSIPGETELIPAEVPDPNEPQEITCGNHLFDLWTPSPQAPFGLQALYDALPTCLGGYERDGATRALTGMLGALKTAAEAALDEGGIEEAFVSTPFPVHKDFNVRLRAAFSALGLKKSDDAFWAASMLGKGNGARCSCDGRPADADMVMDELVLVLDHSSSALTATLGTITDCIFDARRILRAEELGAWGLRNLSWWEYDGEAEKDQMLQSRNSMLFDALRRLTALPLGEKLPGDDEMTAVDRLVLLGETTNDEKLHEALGEIFGERLGALLDDGGGNDPLYNAAEYMARCSLESKKPTSKRMEL